jgi:hypothetical protein
MMKDMEHKLEQALKAHTEPGRRVPDRVDRAVLAVAHARAEQIRRAGARVNPWARILRYAAAVLVGVLAASGVVRITNRGHRSPPHEFVTRGVDITDAYALACRIDSGQVLEEDDFNQDGRVDRADIEALARAAVRIRG